MTITQAWESPEETLNLAGSHSARDCWNDSVMDEVLQGRKMVRGDLKHTTQEGPLVLEAMDQGRVGCLGLGALLHVLMAKII